MASYFALEVFAVDAVVYPDVLVQDGYDSGSQVSLAFQFLDYPLLVVHAGSEAQPAWGSAERAAKHSFASGKSCVLQADPDELAFLSEQVRCTRTQPQSACRPQLAAWWARITCTLWHL